jgi:hypothetical protein
MNDSKSPSLTPEARRLEAIKLRLSGDSLLNFLVGLASGRTFSVSLNITLILDGVLVRGEMTGPYELATVLDTQLQSTLKDAPINFDPPPEPNNEGDIRSALGQALERTFQNVLDRAEQRIERGRKAMEDAWGSPEGWGDHLPRPDELPDEAAEDALEALTPPRTVTLRNAEILWPVTGRWTPVGYMRIALSHVSGWCFTAPEAVQR